MADFYGHLARQVGSEEESEISDVDPSELAKMVEDVDDLDAGLFGSANASKSSAPSKPAAKSVLKPSQGDVESADKHSKPKVTFSSTNDMEKKSSKINDFDDFDLDDPFEDLLSDGDDILSGKQKKVRGHEQQKESVENKTKGVAIESSNNQTKAKVIAELFGLNEENKEEKQPVESKSSSKWLGLEASDPPLQTKKSVTVAEPPVESNSQGNEKIITLSKKPSLSKQMNIMGDDNLLEGLGFGGDQQKENISQPKSKLDELFGKGGTKSTGLSQRSMLDDILQGKKKSGNEELEKPADAGRKDNLGQQQASTGNVALGSYSPSVSTSGRRQVGRRGSAGGTGVFDPLGLFSPKPSPSKESQNVQNTSGINAGHSSGDWLPVPESINAAPMKKSQSLDVSERHEKEKGGGDHSLPEWLGGSRVVRTSSEISQVIKPSVPQGHSAGPPQSTAISPRMSQSAPQLTATGGNVLAAGTAIDHQLVASLQHQETQLLTALNLKQHEERLVALQQRQQEILSRQEVQLEELIKKQIERQEQLDAQMRSQQERINAHIQMLLMQPKTSSTVLPSVLLQSSIAPPVAAQQKTIGNNGPVAEKTEEEVRKHIESSIQNLKVQHEEELRLLEDSYRRQISFLESTLEKQEQRLQIENDRVSREYATRLFRMEEELKSLAEQQQKRLTSLQNEHSEEVLRLREIYRQSLEDAWRQQAEMLEHLNRSHALETENIKEGSSYSRSLAVTMEQLKTNTEDLSALYTKLDSQHQAHLDIREAALHAKEAELKVVRESLEKQRAASEEERKKLLALVSELEQRLAEQRQQTEEDRWSIKQEAARLEAANQALQRERKQVTQQLDKERQQVQVLKDSILLEQKTLSEQLQQEKLNLAAEKSRLETLARLHGDSSPEISKMRAELEVGLKVTQEAKKKVEAERQRLCEQERQLNEQRHSMEEMERNLTSKAREVEVLSHVARTAKEEGRKLLEEAHRLEQQRSFRANDIQQQLVELREREKRLVQEKMILAQQQFALQNARDKQLCIYCRKPKDILSPPSSPMEGSKRCVDPKLIIMKLIAEDEASLLNQDSQFMYSAPSVSK